MKLPGAEALVSLLHSPDALYTQTHEAKSAALAEQSDQFLSTLRESAAAFGCAPLLHTYPILLTPRDEFRVEARLIDGTAYVIVHRGFCSLLLFAFAADLIDSAATNRLTPLTVLKNILVARYFVGPFTLPSLEALLPAPRRMVLSAMLSAAQLFAVLHEIAHITLGHVDHAHSHDMMAPITNAELARLEHEADRTACSYISMNEEIFVHGAVTMLSQLDLCETVLGPFARTHPTARQRMLELRAYFDERGVTSGLNDLDAKARTDVTPHFASTLLAIHPYELAVAAMEAAREIMECSPDPLETLASDTKRGSRSE